MHPLVLKPLAVGLQICPDLSETNQSLINPAALK